MHCRDSARGCPLLPAPFKIWPSAPRYLSFLYHCSLFVLPKILLPSPCSLRFLPFPNRILRSGDRSKYVSVLVVESKIGVRKLAERSEAKKNLKNHVRFFDIMPRIICSLLPKIIFLCSLFPFFWAPCSLLPVLLDPILPAP